mgnify:CR=1 FL=1
MKLETVASELTWSDAPKKIDSNSDSGTVLAIKANQIPRLMMFPSVTSVVLIPASTPRL